MSPNPALSIDPGRQELPADPLGDQFSPDGPLRPPSRAYSEPFIRPSSRNMDF